MEQLFETLRQYLTTETETMLDRTKCSTTARKIFNLLARSDSSKIDVNDNLIDICQDLMGFKNLIRDALNRIYFVHFHHHCGTDSHYFVVYQLGNHVTVLQSAVFDFSLAGWLFPEMMELEAEDEYKIRCEIINLEHDGRRKEIFLDAANRQMLNELHMVSEIKACDYSQKKVHDAEKFCQSFVHDLENITGIWQSDNLESKCTSYRRIFAGQPDHAEMSNLCKLDKRLAQVKFIYRDLPFRNDN